MSVKDIRLSRVAERSPAAPYLSFSQDVFFRNDSEFMQVGAGFSPALLHHYQTFGHASGDSPSRIHYRLSQLIFK